MKKKYNKKNIMIILGFIMGVLLLYYNLSRVNKPYDFLKSLTASIINIKDDKVVTNNYYESEINELNKEINDLKNITDINTLLTDKTIINASIIKRSPNYWYNYITINKGSKNGIKIGNAVISNNGLVGEVIVANDNSSEVKLISSINKNYLSAKFTYNDKEYYGLIKEYNIRENELYLENVIGDISDFKDINVVTSGLSSSMIPGIPVGKVINIKKDRYNLSNILVIKPYSDLNNINIVRVLIK